MGFLAGLRANLNMTLAAVGVALLMALGGIIVSDRIEIASLERAIEYWKGLLSSEKQDRAEERTRLVVAASQAASANRAKEQSLYLANQKASDDYERALQRRDLDISTLRAERQRLRNQIIAYSRAPIRSASSADPGPVSSADARTEKLGDLLAEGIGLQDEGVDLVNALTLQVVGLQRYITDNGLSK